MNLFKELDIEDRLQWKVHKMIFAMQVISVCGADIDHISITLSA